MRVHPQLPALFVTGGKESDLKVYEVAEASLKTLFQAKNVRPSVLLSVN